MTRVEPIIVAGLIIQFEIKTMWVVNELEQQTNGLLFTYHGKEGATINLPQ